MVTGYNRDDHAGELKMNPYLEKDAMKQLHSVNRNLVDRVYEIKQPIKLSIGIYFLNLRPTVTAWCSI